jgi:hypothetical protein
MGDRSYNRMCKLQFGMFGGTKAMFSLYKYATSLQN